MTRFSGPGFYSIVSYQAPDLVCNSWGGGMEPGEPVKLYPKSPMTNNQIWAILPVKDNGDQTEFVILNCRNGYYLVGNPDNKTTTSKQASAMDAKARWILTYSQQQGRYDVYFINCVDKSCGQLNVSGAGKTQGTDILSWPVSGTDNCLFYLDRQSL